MGPGFKYHVVTVAAIFFALTIGLVVGSLFLSPQVIRTQSNLLRSLNTKVSKDIKERDQEVDRYRKCLAAAMPQAVSGKLTGHHIAILVVGEYPDEAVAIRETLESAGARVTCLLTIDRGFARPDELLASKLITLHDNDPRLPRDRQGLSAIVAAILAHGDTVDNPVLPVLERAELVRLDPNSVYQSGAGEVVLVAGSRMEAANRIPQVDQPIIGALQRLGLIAVMCEPEHAGGSDVPGYHAANIDVGTVDDIDSDIGRFGLVYVLRGAKDDYGVKSTAKYLLPPMSN